MVQGFDIDEAVKLFDRFTRGKGNLLNSKLVSFFIKIHWVLFFITSEKNNTNVYDLTPYIHSKQILLPYFKCSHYCLYVMNRYKKSVQIIDSLSYGKKDLRTFNSFHYDLMTIVSAEFT